MLIAEVVETLNFLVTLSSARMERAAAGVLAVRLGTAGGSLNRWAEIALEMRRVLLCRVMDEDVNREERLSRGSWFGVREHGDPEDFDWDNNNV